MRDHPALAHLPAGHQRLCGAGLTHSPGGDMVASIREARSVRPDVRRSDKRGGHRDGCAPPTAGTHLTICDLAVGVSDESIWHPFQNRTSHPEEA
jgi:hypothetical protein